MRTAVIITLLLFPGLLRQSCSFHRRDGKSASPPQEAITLAPQLYISYLPSVLQESSGLLLFRGHFMSMNDSGGPATLFVFHRRTGELLQSIAIENAVNRDWEALAQDEDYIYIGDVGNNSGARKDLRVFRVRKADIPPEGDAKVSAELISFQYADQDDYSHRGYSHSYDCEAMVAYRDSLWLFTKDWLYEKTRLYVLPAVPGSYSLAVRDSFPAFGLITDASYLEPSRMLALSGYREFSPFVLIFNDFGPENYFKTPFTRIEMPYIYRVQTEGISILNADSVFISSERTDLPPQLYLLKISR